MNKYVKALIGAAAGGTLGYAYYYFIGCSGGSCPITSNWEYSVFYGIAAGVVLSFPSKKRGDKNVGRSK